MLTQHGRTRSTCLSAGIHRADAVRAGAELVPDRTGDDSADLVESDRVESAPQAARMPAKPSVPEARRTERRLACSERCADGMRGGRVFVGCSLLMSGHKCLALMTVAGQ